MSRIDDYRGEMLGATISDEEIERLLSAQPTKDGGLTDLVPFVAMMRSYGAIFPSEAAIDLLATKAAAIVRSQPSSPIVVPSTNWSPRARRLRLQPKLVAALATIVLLWSLTGVAVAADGAAPGDPLYGIDRALEQVGIGAGLLEERLDEANTLIVRGQAKEALDHVATAFEEAEAEDIADLEEARVALEQAAQNLQGVDEGGEQASVVQENVALLLQYLQQNIGKDVGTDGKEFGQGVADLARGIWAGEQNVTDHPGPNVDDTGPPDSPPGQDNRNENGAGSGNGPPDDSPSDTAPGQGK